MDESPYLVERWLRIREAEGREDPPFQLDDAGFLAPALWWLGLLNGLSDGGLIHPADALASAGALVLLGEPGLGKTTTFHQLAPKRDEDPKLGEPGTIWVSGAELAEPQDLDDRVGRFLTAWSPDAVDQGHTLTIVFDQLDESPLLAKGFSRRLQRMLKSCSTDQLRILVACRTAECPTDLTPILTAQVGRCVVADLAPLTRQDAIAVAQAAGVDGRACIDAIVASGAGGLASVPLILTLLIDTYKTNRIALENGPYAVFDQGIRALAGEWDRLRNRHPVETTADQRLAVAGRIAARLLLSGRRSIRLDGRPAAATDMTDSSLPGGAEHVSGAPFDVTTPIVRETLRTALFTSAGTDRVTFRHSSIAAFLAARYLTDLDIPQKQLQDLLLVDAPDEDSAAIPTPLRETAAWCVQMTPRSSAWLVNADPDAILAYSIYLTDPDTRRTLIDGLFGKVELVAHGSWSWQPVRWHLDHPGLAAQLRPALTPDLDPGGVADEDTINRLWLATRIAEDATALDLVESLLDIVEHTGLPTPIRERAMRTAYRLDPDHAAPRLRTVLAALQPHPAENPGRDDTDDRDELVGEILLQMWPTHLMLDDVLPHLHRTTPTNRGSLREAFRSIPSRAPTDQLRPLLTDILSHSTTEGPGDPNADIDPDGPRLVGSVPTDTVDSVIARCLALTAPDPYLPDLAALIAPRLFAHTDVPIPPAVDLLGADGTEPAPTTKVRHALALALIQEVQSRNPAFDRGHAFFITRYWRTVQPVLGWSDEDAPAGLTRAGRTRLLDTHDFAWGLQTADELRTAGQVDLGNAVGLTAIMAADPSDPRTRELGETRYNTPEWTHLAPWYQPAIDGLPDDSRPGTARRRRPRDEFDATAFQDTQRDNYERALSGHPSAYIQFVLKLRHDPQTGQSVDSDTDDIRGYPGVSVLDGPLDVDALAAASLTYLIAEHDHREDWLGQAGSQGAAAAGDLALALLYHTRRLQEVPAERWSHWAGVPFTLDWGHAGRDEHRMRTIVGHLNQHAPTELAACTYREVEGNLRVGRGTPELGYLSNPADAVVDVLIQLAEYVLTVVDRAPDPGEDRADRGRLVAQPAVRDTWHTLLGLLLEARPHVGLDVITRVLDHLADSENHVRLGAATAMTFLQHDPHQAWPHVHTALRQSEEFGKVFASMIYHDDMFDAILTELDASELVEFYRDLAAFRPPDHDTVASGTLDDLVIPGDVIRPARDQVLRSLIGRGAADAVRELQGLVSQYPTITPLKRALAAARRNCQEQSFPHLTPENVAELLRNPHWRNIHTNNQLALVIIDTLRQIEHDLQTHSNLLWDCERRTEHADDSESTEKETWRPKPEEALSAYINHELLLRLGSRGILMNREVQIRPTDAKGAGGERVDVLAQTLRHPDPRRTQPHPQHDALSVTIEIKGAWNDEVPTSQTDQLAQRYLRSDQDGVGVYLVVIFRLDQWTSTDHRKAEAKKRSDPALLQQQLDAEADAIRANLVVRTYPVIMTITRAEKAPKR